MPHRVTAAVVVDDVLEPLVQVHDNVVPYPFVRVVDDLRGGEAAVTVAVRVEVAQAHVLLDDGGDLRETVLAADLAAHAGMVALAVQAGGFGDVVEQGAGDHQLPVRLGPFRVGGDQPADQLFGQPCDHQRVVTDVRQHLVALHQLEAGGKRRHGYGGNHGGRVIGR